VAAPRYNHILLVRRRSKIILRFARARAASHDVAISLRAAVGCMIPGPVATKIRTSASQNGYPPRLSARSGGIRTSACGNQIRRTSCRSSLVIALAVEGGHAPRAISLAPRFSQALYPRAS
jgi:hypothetical protein